MVDVFIGLELFGICTMFVALVILLNGESSSEQKLMAYFLAGSLVQNVGYLIELTASGMDAAVAALRIENLGSTFIPVCYCVFLYKYCYLKPPMKLIRTIAVMDFIILPVIFFFDRHTLFYSHIDWLATDYGYHYLSLEYGVLYYPIMVLRLILPYIISIYALAKAIISNSEGESNRQYRAILALSVLPVLALLAYVMKMTQVFDPAPVSLGLTLSIVTILVWSRRNYDFRHIAARTVLEGIGDGVIALDYDKRLVSYNTAATGIFTDISSYRAGDYIDKVKYFSDEMFDEDAPVEFNIDDRYYESHAKIIYDDGRKQGYVILVLDVTDTRNYIEEIKEVRIQAEKANIAKSEFLANMSHEIRTPMNAIIGFSDIIIEESQGRKVYTYAKDIQGAAKNLLAIINDILDLSKVEAGKMELVMVDYYIKNVIEEVVGMMDMAASQHGIILKYEYDDTIPCQYYGDDVRIKQILINLMNNAVKFTNEGYVRLTVNGRPGGSEDEEVIEFQIEDTGCGIREEDQAKIFEDFGQVDTKRNRKVDGTGLGLSIVRHLVSLMNGRIELKSTYGVGTTFTVTIPQKIVDSRSIADMPDVSEVDKDKYLPFHARGVKVLVVDDNLINRKVAKEFLKIYEFELSEAASGAEAIDLVKDKMFDIIFMDHMMPEMDGIEAVRIIRRECGENGIKPVIIALTANAMEGAKSRFLSSGFQDYIAKPLDRKQLNEMLIEWIPKERRVMLDDEEDETDNMLDPGEVNIKGIDIYAVLKYYSDSSLDDYVSLLELFCIDGARKSILIEELIENGDYETYGVEVHGLKSSAANIGAVELSEMAKKHEYAANREDYNYITNNLQELLTTYKEQLKAIQAYLDENKSLPGNGSDEVKDGEDGGSLPNIDNEALLNKAGEALGLLERFRSRECADIIEELLNHSLDETIKAELEEIRKQLKLYEDDNAEELLRNFVDRYGSK